MKDRSFKTYIFRLLKTLRKNSYHITRQAMEAVDSITKALAEKVVALTIPITRNDSKKTISISDLKTAIKILTSSDTPLGLARAEKAVELFTVSELERKDVTIEHPQTRESRCNLVFSVSVAEKFLRTSNLKVSSTASVFLAGFLEDVIRYLLDKTLDVTETNDRITVSIRHLFLTSARDPKLSFLLRALGVVFLESGVEPQNVQIKKRVRKRTKDPSLPKSSKGHRWKPGTKTVMDIRRLQRKGDTLIQHAPFNRAVKSVVSSLFGDLTIRYTKDFFSTLQAFVEERLLGLMAKANKVAQHAGRETVYQRDIDLVSSIEGCLPHDLKTPDLEIPEASIRYLALRAGIRRYGEDSTLSYKKYMIYLLEKYIFDMVQVALHNKMQTLNTKILIEALNMSGVFITVTPHKRKGVRKGKAKRSKSQEGEESSEASEAEETSEVSEAEDQTGFETTQLSDIEEESLDEALDAEESE